MLQNMFNNNNTTHHHHHHHHDQTMAPRISFSSDFMDSDHLGCQLGAAYKEAPVSSDFEFSVMDSSSRVLTPADEIFFQGKLLPVVDELGGCSDRMRRMTTLREELVLGDCDEERPRRSSGSSGRWMERLGLKKGRSHRGSGGKILERVEEEEEVAYSKDTARKGTNRSKISNLCHHSEVRQQKPSSTALRTSGFEKEIGD